MHRDRDNLNGARALVAQEKADVVMSLSSGHETPAYPGYATPTFTVRGSRWHVVASPWNVDLGTVEPNLPTGWTAWDLSRAYVGLFPDKQAAGEALVKHAGYEVL